MREIIILLISLVLISCNGGDGNNGKANASGTEAKTIYVYDADGQQLGILLGNDSTNIVSNDPSDNEQQQLQIGGSPVAVITMPNPLVEIFIPSLGYIVDINQHTGEIIKGSLWFESLDCTGVRYSLGANKIYQDQDNRYFVGLHGPFEVENPEPPLDPTISCYPVGSALDGNIGCHVYLDLNPNFIPGDNYNVCQIGGGIAVPARPKMWYQTEEIFEQDIPFILPVALPMKYVYK